MDIKQIVFQGKELSVLEDTNPVFFKELDEGEEEAFRQYAHDHPDDEVQSIWHPVLQDEYIKLAKEV